jgi:hypothetical protein
VQSLWLRFFLQTTKIVRHKILCLEVEKNQFFFLLFYMQISTCLRPNIHQNGPKILRVNLSIVKSCQAQFDYVCGHGDFF